MKLIEPKAELLLQPEGIEGVYKQIELCGRTCYKSTDKITDESAKPFVERMIASKHTAMLEQGTVYLSIPCTDDGTLSHYRGVAGKYNEIQFERYSKVAMMLGMYNYVTTNYRVLVENNWLDDLKYICKPTEYHEKRYTIKFTTDRGVSHELVRHRVFSFAQESTRYCNYSKDKFGGEITFIIPYWFEQRATFLKESLPNDVVLGAKVSSKINSYNDKEMVALKALALSEKNYMYLLSSEMTPQQARQILPNALKTEVCMTGFASDWRFFFDLRYYGETGKPHPDMELLVSKARDEFIKAGLWEDIMSYPSKYHHDKDWRNGDLEDKFELIDRRNFKTMKDAKLWILPEEQELEFRDGGIVSALEEKKFKPKFKVGDVIQMIDAPQFKSTIKKIKNEGYLCNNDFITFDQEHKWELVMPDIKCNGCELQESEDEKIRKDIIWCFKHSGLKDSNPINPHVTTTTKDAIAWLEKQGNTNETINRDEFAQGVLRGAAINLITWIDYNVAKGNMCLSNMECKDIEDALVSGDWDKIYAYIKKKLEKPGEQKPVIEMKTPEESLGIDSDTYNKIVDECIYGEQKPAWGEEDERFVHGLIRGLAAKRDIHGHTTFSSDCIDITKTISWLKSLKNRVQPNQEWSEEDSLMIDETLYFVQEFKRSDRCKNESDLQNAVTCEHFLKSLRPQNKWKPSDEQMEALEHFVRSIGESGYVSQYDNNTKLLYSLLFDLKKL